MKKLISLLVAIVLLCSTFTFVQADDSVPVFLNGTPIKKAGIIISDRTYLPVRALCEALNLAVEWEDDTKSVMIGKMPLFTQKTDAVNIYLDGIRMENAQAIILDGSTYLPVRALCEGLDMEVLWDEEKREVHVIEKLRLDYPMDAIVESDGFSLLSPDEKERFIAYTTNTLPIGNLMRKKIINEYMSDYLSMSGEEQKTTLISLLSETLCFRTSAYGQILPQGEKAKYEIISTTYDSSYDVWRGTQKSVTIRRIRMESDYENLYHEWDMISSADSAAVDSIIGAMSRFPYGIRRFIKTVVYDPDDSNLCYGGGNTIWVRVSWIPSENQAAKDILSCVAGYVFDANTTTDKAHWDNAIKDDIIPVSKFGNTNRVSDLGEFTCLYLIAKNMENGLSELEKLYPNRFAVFAAMLYRSDNAYYENYKHYADKTAANIQ